MTGISPPDSAKFSYHQTAPQRSAAEECDRNWLVSHAIAESASQGVPFLLESVTKAKYSMFFSNVDAPFGMSRPTPYGFVPGKESVHFPELPFRKRVQGKTTARISVDAAGKVTDVKIIEDTLAPATVTSGDGRVFNSKEMFQAMLQNYFKAGTFPAQQDQGKLNPFDIAFAWQLGIKGKQNFRLSCVSLTQHYGRITCHPYPAPITSPATTKRRTIP